MTPTAYASFTQRLQVARARACGAVAHHAYLLAVGALLAGPTREVAAQQAVEPPHTAEQTPQVDIPNLGTLDAALRAAGCPARQILELEQRWYAACGVEGVLVLQRTAEQTFEPIERRRAAGEARALFVHDGTVWVEVQQAAAYPLHELAAQGPTSATPGGSSPPPLSALAAPPPVIPAPPLARAEPESLVAPPRMGGVLALEASLRPFLPIGTLAFAGLAELAATYRGEGPWYVAGRAFPLGGLIGKGRDVGVFGALVSAGYDHALFSVGLGAGALRRGIARYTYMATSSSPVVTETFTRDEGMALALSQAARLGSLDGLHLSVTNVFVLDDQRWRFGMIDLALQIPVGRRTWATLQWGGAEQAGYFYVETGLRRLLWGSRGDGSLFVRPSVGLAGIDPRTSGGMELGPMVGVHLEWRRGV